MERLESNVLWKRFAARHQEFETKKGVALTHQRAVQKDVITWKVSQKLGYSLDAVTNQVVLFHGTKPALVKDICASGFNERLGSLNGLYGAGAYFAEQSSKSDQYAEV